MTALDWYHNASTQTLDILLKVSGDEIVVHTMECTFKEAFELMQAVDKIIVVVQETERKRVAGVIKTQMERLIKGETT